MCFWYTTYYKFNYFFSKQNKKKIVNKNFSFLFPPLYERKLLETSFAQEKEER